MYLLFCNIYSALITAISNSYLCLQVTDVHKYLKLLVTSSFSSLKGTSELGVLFMVMQENEKKEFLGRLLSL